MPKTKINGPINVVRMEGAVNGINKIIYLFMDEHVSLSKQSNCSDPKNSIDITKYFKTSFTNLNKNKNKTYDFFMETFPNTLAYELNELNELVEWNKPDSERIYIENLWKFFYENVKFDKETNTLTSLFSNVRLHYIDIRDTLYLFLVDPLSFTLQQIKHIHNLIAEMVKTSLTVLLDFMKYVKNILKTNKFDSLDKKRPIDKLDTDIVSFLLTPKIQKEYSDRFVYLLDKLLNDYDNDNIKKLIRMYIKNSLLVLWNQYIIDLTVLFDKIKDLKNEDYNDQIFVNQLKDELYTFYRRIFAYISRFVDLYFLRRFLDKNYITNAIVYTGAAHSVSYIYILNNLGFKITHCAKSVITNINKLNKAIDVIQINPDSKIKNLPTEETLFDLIDLFIPPEKVSIQCTDMSDFPSNFE